MAVLKQTHDFKILRSGIKTRQSKSQVYAHNAWRKCNEDLGYLLYYPLNQEPVNVEDFMLDFTELNPINDYGQIKIANEPTYRVTSRFSLDIETRPTTSHGVLARSMMVDYNLSFKLPNFEILGNFLANDVQAMCLTLGSTKLDVWQKIMIPKRTTGIIVPVEMFPIVVRDKVLTMVGSGTKMVSVKLDDEGIHKHEVIYLRANTVVNKYVVAFGKYNVVPDIVTELVE